MPPALRLLLKNSVRLRGSLHLRQLSNPALPSYARGPSHPPLLNQTIGSAFKAIVSKAPSAAAVCSVHQGIRLSYQQLSDAVDVAARALIAAGVKRGDRVGILSPNKYVSNAGSCHPLSRTCAAVWSGSSCSCPQLSSVPFLSTSTLRELLCLQLCAPACVCKHSFCVDSFLLCSYRLNELIHAVNASGLSLLFATESFKTSDYRSMLKQGRDAMPSLQRTIFIQTSDWDDLLSCGDKVAADAVSQRAEQLHCSDAINIQFTSGTTALPKGATLSHRNILNNGFQVGSLLNYTSADRVCIPVPLCAAPPAAAAASHTCTCTTASGW
jgi:fatty-acyl-CoA synthase